VAGRLRSRTTFGHLAHVDGRTVEWVNASFCRERGLYRLAGGNGPEPQSVIGVSRFVDAVDQELDRVSECVEVLTGEALDPAL
jgi:hypothetical protein